MTVCIKVWLGWGWWVQIVPINAERPQPLLRSESCSSISPLFPISAIPKLVPQASWSHVHWQIKDHIFLCLTHNAVMLIIQGPNNIKHPLRRICNYCFPLCTTVSFLLYVVHKSSLKKLIEIDSAWDAALPSEANKRTPTSLCLGSATSTQIPALKGNSYKLQWPACWAFPQPTLLCD